MTTRADRPRFSLIVEIESNEHGVFIQTTLDGRVSTTKADINADVVLAIPALMSAAYGAMTETPDA